MATDVATTPYDHVLPRISVLVARGLLYLIAAILIVGLTWASITRVNVVVRADGRLVPQSEPVRLSVPQGGIVSKVLVDVGAKVIAGQPILEIDPFREAADAAADRHELEQAKAESARYTENASMLEAATVNLGQELGNERQVLKLMSAQADELREGFDGGAVSLFELQAKERDVAETQARISQLTSDLTRSEAESRQNGRMETETAQKIKELEIKLSRDVEVTQKTVLAAPTAGVVTTIGSVRPGRYLAANDIAATINPADEPLLAEIWIPNDSMRRVKPPLPVRMKLKAYPYQQFGLLPGTLVSVDPDADQSGAYRAWIKPDRLTLTGAHGAETLGPGLALTAEIVVDHRTVLDVILDPIRRVRRGFSIAE
ncbi:MAG: HlyD family secretion protein [Candidatus Binataceae bacterium]